MMFLDRCLDRIGLRCLIGMFEAEISRALQEVDIDTSILQ